MNKNHDIVGVVELPLCKRYDEELRPDVLYSFHVEKGCARCAEFARPRKCRADHGAGWQCTRDDGHAETCAVIYVGVMF